MVGNIHLATCTAYRFWYGTLWYAQGSSRFIRELANYLALLFLLD